MKLNNFVKLFIIKWRLFINEYVFRLFYFQSESELYIENCIRKEKRYIER